MALKDFQKKGNSGNSNFIGGGAIRVLEYLEVADAVTIKAEVYFDSLGKVKGDLINVTLAPANADKIKANLRKGMGSTPDSILLVENCTKGQTDDTIQTNWVTTAVSGTKKEVPGSLHGVANVDRAFVSTPIISFKNPSRAKDEPDYVRFALTQSTARLKTAAGYKTFDRNFLIQKLGLVEKKDVRVTAIATNGAYAEVAADVTTAIDLVAKAIEGSNTLAIVRIKGEEDHVEAAYLRKPYDKELNDYLADLSNLGLFSNIPNETVNEGVASGAWTLEVTPAFEVPFLGDALDRLIVDMQKPLDDLKHYTGLYGEESLSQMTDVALVTAPTGSGEPFFFHEPISIDRRNRVQMKYLKTAAISVEAPARPDYSAQNANGEAPAAGAPAADSGAGGNEDDFDASQYSIGHAGPTDDLAAGAEQPAGQTAAGARRAP